MQTIISDLQVHDIRTAEAAYFQSQAIWYQNSKWNNLVLLSIPRTVQKAQVTYLKCLKADQATIIAWLQAMLLPPLPISSNTVQ